MPLTVAQIDALLTAAYAAIHVGELSFTGPGGKVTSFHSLDAFTRYIDWLERNRAEAAVTAAVAAGTGGYAPTVRFQELQG